MPNDAVVIGNKQAFMELAAYASDIEKGAKRRPIMLVGPPGTGKSLSANAIAEQHNWNVVELNASDYRDKDTIEKRLVSASQTRSLFGKKNLILLDEIDELAGRFDKGAGSAISNLIKVSKNPIVFTANDRWAQSISFLRQAVDYIEFKKLMPFEVAEILEKYIAAHGIKVSKQMIDMVSNRCNGDARCAINDIDVLDGATEEATEIIGLRDKKVDVFQTLDKIFFSNTYSAPLMAATNSDVDNNMLIKWIDENIPKRYTERQDLADAYAMLASASSFFNNATRSQYYTYWRYMNVMMTSGVALAKNSYPDRTRRYTFPKTISELSRTKESRGTGYVIAEKLRKRIHTNEKRILKHEMKLLGDMIRDSQKTKESEESTYDFFTARFGLETKEIDWIAENAT